MVATQKKTSSVFFFNLTHQCSTAFLRWACDLIPPKWWIFITDDPLGVEPKQHKKLIPHPMIRPYNSGIVLFHSSMEEKDVIVAVHIISCQSTQWIGNIKTRPAAEVEAAVITNRRRKTEITLSFPQWIWGFSSCRKGRKGSAH